MVFLMYVSMHSIVMRREQVHKICLNHALTDDIDYQPKGDNSWHFVANDYSDGTVELLQFCLRFKTADIAKSFKTAACDALSGKLTAPAADSTAVIKNGIANLSSDDQQLADRLKFAPEFFDYHEANACAGCRGCRSDEFVFPDYANVCLEHIDAEPLPLRMPVRAAAGRKANSANTSVLKQSTFSFATPSPATTSSSGGNLFATASTSLFSGATKTPTIFGGGSGGGGDSWSFGAGKPTTSIFDSDSGNATTTKGGNIFASAVPTKLFGNSDDSKDTPNKPLPAVSFSFGSPFSGGAGGGGSAASPFQLPTASAANNVTSTTSISTNSTGFSFGNPTASNTTATNAVTNATNATASTTPMPKPFSFALGTNNATDSTGNEADQSVNQNTSDNSGGYAPISTFGGAAVFKPAEKDTKIGNIFGSPESTIAPKGGGSLIFGGGFTTLSSNSTVADANDAAIPFKDTGLSFASISSATGGAPAANGFGGAVTAASSGGFFGLSKKDDFTSFQRTLGAGESAGSSGTVAEVAGGEDPNYDPHYDPIIELPDEIEVKTGEEDEVKVFGERAKLFRYDTTNREWKERGKIVENGFGITFL